MNLAPTKLVPGLTFPPQVECLAIGQTVYLGEGRGPAVVVTAIVIRSGPSVQYEVVWWDSNNARQCQWVQSSEIRLLKEPEVFRIRFKP